MKINPLISVVIPVYNYPEALESTLQSVIAQSYSNLEVLVVDENILPCWMQTTFGSKTILKVAWTH